MPSFPLRARPGGRQEPGSPDCQPAPSKGPSAGILAPTPSRAPWVGEGEALTHFLVLPEEPLQLFLLELQLRLLPSQGLEFLRKGPVLLLGFGKSLAGRVQTLLS